MEIIIMAKKGIRRFTRKFINFSGWVGYSSLKRTAGQIFDLARQLYTIQKAERKETFEEAVQRLQFSEEHIEERLINFRNMARVYLAVFAGGLLYMAYLLIHQYYMASIMMVSFLMLIISFYFRESFWYTQLKQRKLGLTFSDWFYLQIGLK
ncbi:MAG TPA: hypothetical protein QF353_03370 [Gammaproteobacteria bacterium]|nr:hypothetical protein [Gammaproteobacteria bacterium]